MFDKAVLINRAVAKEFLKGYFQHLGIERPVDISEDALVEIFCEYVESDYHEWFNDNFRSLFDTGHPFSYQNPDWNWIKEIIEQSRKD